MDFGELDKALMRRPSSQPALFSLPRIEPRHASNRAMVSGQLPPQCPVPGTMPFPVPRLVCVAGYIQRPVPPVRNAPASPHYAAEPLPQLRQVSANHIPQFYALQAAPTPSSEFSSVASPGNRSSRRRRAAPGDSRSRTARLRWIGAPSPIISGLPNIASRGCCRNQTTSSL